MYLAMRVAMQSTAMQCTSSTATHPWPVECQHYMPRAVSLTGLALNLSTAAVHCASHWLQDNVYSDAAAWYRLCAFFQSDQI